MSDLHPTFPAKTGAAGVVVWVCVGIAVLAFIGAVWTLVTA